ncbi:hypothetical protein BDU57DRAFT_91241 [Ampelomyces quisqualis]|uniref:F-box domain-containing protein n=1 Tax=Ampelomyces quisqualis TaxID=50730 RepID=A0A6A5Q866_AMPQU|nr:hypothetical protein BDU57DRAFT_91241 [Ampelomyces quisqualis]
MPSYLQAPCLVFTSWNHVAAASLYKGVMLDIRLQDSQLLRCEQCLQIGALEQLRHIQSLNLSGSAANLDLLADSEERESELAECARQDAILRLLQLLPDNKISSFRYTCETPLRGACIQKLDDHQLCIQNIHIIRSDPLQLPRHSRRSITASFNDTRARTDAFAEFPKKVPFLDSLSLQLSGSWEIYDAMYWFSMTDPLDGGKICTRKLTMYGYMSNGFTSSIPRIFDWAMVSSLSLFDGNVSLLFDAIASIPELCDLVHLQCCTIEPEESRILQCCLQRN